jgi:hypothetical protein
MGGCNWVSNKWSSLFRSSSNDEGLAAAPESERARISEPMPKTAPVTPVMQETMAGNGAGAGVGVGAGDPARPQMMDGPKSPMPVAASKVAAMSDSELRGRVAALDQQLQAIRSEMNETRPSVDRLVRMEGDIRQLVTRLTQLSGPGGAAPPPPAMASDARKAAPTKAAEKSAKPMPAAAMPEPAPVAALEPDALFADTAQFAVHLASYRSELRAAQGWREYRQHFKPLLETLQPRVLGIDFNDGRGLFFRLKGGPFPTKAAAQTVCDAIHERGEYCKVEEFTGTPLAQATALR